MKKLILTVLALVLVTAVNAQGGRGYSGTHHSGGGHGQPARPGTGYHQTQTPNRGTGYYHGHANGARYNGAVQSGRNYGYGYPSPRYAAPAHTCTGYCGAHGHYRQTRNVYRYYNGRHCNVVEGYYWVPGRYVYNRGCNTWMDGYWEWRVIR
ncbi:MAG: hypothetical protein H6581_31430 [Bacteroidia bacterium]|nr:hypothetical protein [Bacteroidia bacterium]